jgi:sugar O-acyltransferase (sialic acid O-acetyltransferase NeuD family)
VKTLAILGSADLGQQIAYYAISDNHYEKIIFFDDFNSDRQVNGFQIIGGSDTILSSFKEGLFDELIIAIGYKHLNKKKEAYEYFIQNNIPLGKIIHSSVWVDKSAIIEQGSVVYPGCIIDSKALISANSVLNVGCTIAHDTVIGKHSFLSPRVAIAGFVKVGEQCILGINSTLIDNIEIANQTQIGGGTVVISSITTPGLYVGNPHRFIR